MDVSHKIEATTFAEMSDDERRYVCANRDAFPHLDEEIKRFFADFWAASRKREDERAAMYPPRMSRRTERWV